MDPFSVAYHCCLCMIRGDDSSENAEMSLA